MGWRGGAGGLYGSLRPLDLIQPYRLEMGTKGSPTWGGEPTLYGYWGGRIADDLVAALRVGTTPACVADDDSRSLARRAVLSRRCALVCFRRSRRGRASW